MMNELNKRNRKKLSRRIAENAKEKTRPTAAHNGRYMIMIDVEQLSAMPNLIPLGVNDLQQFAYCPRIVFYNTVTKGLKSLPR